MTVVTFFVALPSPTSRPGSGTSRCSPPALVAVLVLIVPAEIAARCVASARALTEAAH